MTTFATKRWIAIMLSFLKDFLAGYDCKLLLLWLFYGYICVCGRWWTCVFILTQLIDLRLASCCPFHSSRYSHFSLAVTNMHNSIFLSLRLFFPRHMCMVAFLLRFNTKFKKKSTSYPSLKELLLPLVPLDTSKIRPDPDSSTGLEEDMQAVSICEDSWILT